VIGDDFRQIGWVRTFGNDRRRVRDVLEQRTVRKERAARHEDDTRFWATITGEICSSDGAAIVQHDIQHQDFGFALAEELDGALLAVNDMDGVVLTFEMASPNTRQVAV